MHRLHLLVVVGALLVVSDAQAQSQATQTESETAEANDEEARARFEAGRALVQVGSYAAGRDEFQRGFELSERPLFIFNMAECDRRLENEDDARREYAEYLRLEPDGAFFSIAEARLYELGAGDTSTPDFIEAMRSPASVDLAPDGSAQTTAVLDTSEPTPASGRKWYADWPFWTVVGVVVLGSAIAIGVAASGSSGSACDQGQGCAVVDWRGL